MKLARLRLGVARPERLTAFYVQALGMSCQAGQGIGYGGADIVLEFLPGQGTYRHDLADAYW